MYSLTPYKIQHTALRGRPGGKQACTEQQENNKKVPDCPQLKDEPPSSFKGGILTPQF